MRVLNYLARRRWAGVGLALAVEILVLVALAFAPPSATIGIPAAVAAAIAGTVAVVFGVLAGVAVAAAGALVFASLGGWDAGEIAAIGVWPAIVAAVGLFAHRVERHRLALRQLVEEQEEERRLLALTLHDDAAQTLSAALMTLRAGRAAPGAPAAGTDEARAIINETIKQLRGLAVELSPKALEDYGLAAALAHLADGSSDRTGVQVDFAGGWDGRLSPGAERTLFRFAQAALGAGLERRARSLSIALTDDGGRIAVTVRGHGLPGAAPPPALPSSLRERIQLLGGKLVAQSGDDGLVLRAEVPAAAGVAGSGAAG